MQKLWWLTHGGSKGLARCKADSLCAREGMVMWRWSCCRCIHEDAILRRLGCSNSCRNAAGHSGYEAGVGMNYALCDGCCGLLALQVRWENGGAAVADDGRANDKDSRAATGFSRAWGRMEQWKWAAMAAGAGRRRLNCGGRTWCRRRPPVVLVLPAAKTWWRWGLGFLVVWRWRWWRGNMLLAQIL